GAAASALRFNGEPAAASASLLVRRHATAGPLGIWAGAGVGALTRQGGGSAPLGTLETGAWLRHDRLRASLTIAARRTRLDTVAIVALDDRGLPVVEVPTEPRRPLVAFDATAAAEWRAPTAELSGSATLRRAPRQARGVLGSLYVVGAWWVWPRAALTASAGDLAGDPLRGFPARRLATLGLRWRVG